MIFPSVDGSRLIEPLIDFELGNTWNGPSGRHMRATGQVQFAVNARMRDGRIAGFVGCGVKQTGHICLMGSRTRRESNYCTHRF